MSDLIERLKAASIDDGVSEPIQPDDYALLCKEAADALEAAEGDAEKWKNWVSLQHGNIHDMIAKAKRCEAAEAKRVELERALRELRKQCDHEYRLAKRRTVGFLKTREREHVNGFIAACEAADALDLRTCTCHPDDNPPVPCPRKYALNECIAAALTARLEAAEDALLNLVWDCENKIGDPHTLRHAREAIDSALKERK